MLLPNNERDITLLNLVSIHNLINSTQNKIKFLTSKQCGLLQLDLNSVKESNSKLSKY
jgi:hypothetical protein